MTLYDRCPAATGVPTDDDRRCASNPDGAHRCRRPQDHLRIRESSPSPYPLPVGACFADHVCACSFMWASGDPVHQQIAAQNRDFPRAGREPEFVPSDREVRLPIPHVMAVDFITSRGILSTEPILSIQLIDQESASGASHDLGRWSIVSTETRFSRERGNYYVATLTRRD